MKCVICENEQFGLVASKLRDSDKHEVVKCEICGLVQISPMPSEQDDAEFYDNNMQPKNIGMSNDIDVIYSNSFNDTERRVKFVSQQIPDFSSVLDIGCGYGFFIDAMAKHGFDVIGLEISKEKCEIAKKMTDAHIINIDISKGDLCGEPVDCITLFHVLEHIRNPIEFIRNARQYLTDEGRMIIEVPNVDDLLLRENRAYHDFYWQRAHLYYFNTNTINKCMEAAGFATWGIFYTQRYGMENFMNWCVRNKPQLDKPSYHLHNKYTWLENLYKNGLIDAGWTDTLMIVGEH